MCKSYQSIKQLKTLKTYVKGTEILKNKMVTETVKKELDTVWKSQTFEREPTEVLQMMSLNFFQKEQKWMERLNNKLNKAEDKCYWTGSQSWGNSLEYGFSMISFFVLYLFFFLLCIKHRLKNMKKMMVSY